MNSLRKVLDDVGNTNVTDKQLQSLISEANLNWSSTVSFQDFLKVSTSIE